MSYVGGTSRGARLITRALARRIARLVIKPISRRLGFDLLERHYYSPVPDTGSLSKAVWDTPSDLSGVRLEPRANLEFVEAELQPYIGEFNPPRAPTGRPGEFHLDNGTYESVDAEVLYALIRHLRPTRVIELGSGASSLVLAGALRRNVEQGHGCEYLIFDPFPSREVGDSIATLAELTRLGAADVPLSTFAPLAAGDVLFVDTTHTVKTGGDVNHLVLNVLPVLQPGVVIHFHDIFLPWEYPRDWIERHERYWAEQYLLQAFLAFNRDFEIIFASQAVARAFPEELGLLIESFGPGVSPGSFWMRRASPP